MSKSIILLVKSVLGKFYRHLGIFSGHTELEPKSRSIGDFEINQSEQRLKRGKLDWMRNVPSDRKKEKVEEQLE